MLRVFLVAASSARAKRRMVALAYQLSASAIWIQRKSCTAGGDSAGRGAVGTHAGGPHGSQLSIDAGLDSHVPRRESAIAQVVLNPYGSTLGVQFCELRRRLSCVF